MDSTGDNLLAEFSSVVDAVRCEVHAFASGKKTPDGYHPYICISCGNSHGLITGPTVDSPAAWRSLHDLFLTEVDILSDSEHKQLNISVQSASRSAANRALAQLFEHLNKTEVNYPGTDMRLVYQLRGYTGSSDAKDVT